MDATAIKEAQNEIKTKMEAMRDELKVLGEKLFREGSQDIFDGFPGLTSFSWTQYTPYFNDGDECVFGVNHYSVALRYGQSEEEAEEEENEGTFDSYSAKYADPSVELPSYLSQYKDKRWLFEAGGLTESLIAGVDDDTMKALFGDHVRVTVTRQGVETEYYEHD